MAGVEDALGLVGSTIDQVRFDDCVDAGGFGLVYRGRHLGMDEPVAIKCLRIASMVKPDPVLREAIAGRFRDETKLLYRLSQGNLDIVRCIGGGMLTAPRTSELTPYMILEWLEGKTLAVDLRERRDQERGGRSLTEALELLGSAAGALAYAHEQGVVHRDVKPGNLYLAKTRDGGTRVKVLDFGLAKIFDDESVGMRPSVQTQQGVHFCSPSYGAPEQYSNALGPVGPWTDVYALTLVLYEVMTGKKARPASSLAEGLVRARDPKTGSPTATQLGLSIPREVEALLARAVSIDPGARPRDAGVFWAQLKEAMAKGNLSATMPQTNAAAEMAKVAGAHQQQGSPPARSPFAGTMLMASSPHAPVNLARPALPPPQAAPVPQAPMTPQPVQPMMPQASSMQQYPAPPPSSGRALAPDSGRRPSRTSAPTSAPAQQSHLGWTLAIIVLLLVALAGGGVFAMRYLLHR